MSGFLGQTVIRYFVRASPPLFLRIYDDLNKHTSVNEWIPGSNGHPAYFLEPVNIDNVGGKSEMKSRSDEIDYFFAKESLNV